MMAGNGFGGRQQEGTTGRYIVLFQEGASREAVQALGDQAGVRVAASEEFLVEGTQPPPIPEHASIRFDELNAAVVDVPPDQASSVMRLASDPRGPIMMVEPERIVYASAQPELLRPPNGGRQAAWPGVASPGAGLALPLAERPDLGPERAPSAEYLRGYRDAVVRLVDDMLEQAESAPAGGWPEAIAESATATWGLSATRVVQSQYTGRDVKLAVLDTGFALGHGDFEGRRIEAVSFVPGETVEDGHGHGTHCMGTAGGPLMPAGATQRYGVAYGAELHVAKVLSNAGSGTDGSILAGINWAISRGCAIISMSLGAATQVGQSYSAIFERVAQRAARRGSIIIAAAGNESSRPTLIRPVGHPANCPSIVGVGALDPALAIASFSNAGLNPHGGEVNIAAPGVQVQSAWVLPQRYRTISGTSMATPHVAGIAALFAEATGLRGFALANEVLRRARRLFPVRDFGWGIVQAP